MGLLQSFFAQTRKPEGVLGKLMVNGMNGSGHAKLADWGMAHLGGIAPSNMADRRIWPNWGAEEAGTRRSC